MTKYEIIDGRQCHDITTEATKSFGDWLLDDTIRQAVKVMIEGGRFIDRTAKAKLAKNKIRNAESNWNTIEDFDADLPKIKTYVNEREAYDKRRRLSGKAPEDNPSILQEVHYEKKQQRLFAESK